MQWYDVLTTEIFIRYKTLLTIANIYLKPCHQVKPYTTWLQEANKDEDGKRNAVGAVSSGHQGMRKYVRAAHFLWPDVLAFITFSRAFLIIFFSFRFLRFATVSNEVIAECSKKFHHTT